MDRHQLALVYDAVAMRLETLAGWTRVRSITKKLLAGFSLTAEKKL